MPPGYPFQVQEKFAPHKLRFYTSPLLLPLLYLLFPSFFFSHPTLPLPSPFFFSFFPLLSPSFPTLFSPILSPSLLPPFSLLSPPFLPPSQVPKELVYRVRKFCIFQRNVNFMGTEEELLSFLSPTLRREVFLFQYRAGENREEKRRENRERAERETKSETVEERK